jgi:uncharacterized protein
VTVVSDASPVIALARIDCLHLLRKLYGQIHISAEVYREIAVVGAGLLGSERTARADWIEATPIRGSGLLACEMERTGLAAGEVSTVLLAKELEADLVLIDESKARRYAVSEGLVVTGCIGILEGLYRHNDLPDLRGAYIRLLAEKFRIDLQTLRHSLARFKLPPL